MHSRSSGKALTAVPARVLRFHRLGQEAPLKLLPSQGYAPSAHLPVPQGLAGLAWACPVGPAPPPPEAGPWPST
eukprot:11348747-Alexandrium_andersonii.AAC.1